MGAVKRVYDLNKTGAALLDAHPHYKLTHCPPGLLWYPDILLVVFVQGSS